MEYYEKYFLLFKFMHITFHVVVEKKWLVFHSSLPRIENVCMSSTTKKDHWMHESALLAVLACTWCRCLLVFIYLTLKCPTTNFSHNLMAVLTKFDYTYPFRYSRTDNRNNEGEKNFFGPPSALSYYSDSELSFVESKLKLGLTFRNSVVSEWMREKEPTSHDDIIRWSHSHTYETTSICLKLYFRQRNWLFSNALGGFVEFRFTS